MLAAVVAQPDPEVGRDAVRVRRAEGGRVRDRGGDHRVLPRAHGALQGAEERWSSARCPRPPPARSRSSSCASGRRAPPPSSEPTRSKPMTTMRGGGALPRSPRIPLDALGRVGRRAQSARARLRARPHAQRARLRLCSPQRLADAYRVVCPDIVGRGRSDWLRDPGRLQLSRLPAPTSPRCSRSRRRRDGRLGRHLDGRHPRHDPRGLPGTPVRKLVHERRGLRGPQGGARAHRRPTSGATRRSTRSRRSRRRCARVSPFGAAHRRAVAPPRACTSAQAGRGGPVALPLRPGHRAQLPRGAASPTWTCAPSGRRSAGRVLVIRGEHSDLLTAETLERDEARAPRTETLVVRRHRPCADADGRRAGRRGAPLPARLRRRREARARATYDAVIVGAGHNGLACACYLAAAGMRVCMVERRAVVGGAAVTEEFHPGFRNSTASYTVSLLNPEGDPRPAPRRARAARSSSGRSRISCRCRTAGYIKVGGGLEATQREVARFSKRDAERLPDYYARLEARGRRAARPAARDAAQRGRRHRTTSSAPGSPGGACNALPLAGQARRARPLHDRRRPTGSSAGSSRSRSRRASASTRWWATSRARIRPAPRTCCCTTCSAR